MNYVTVEYNPYIPELNVVINQRNLADFSGLMEFRHRPFTDWCGVLLQELKKEVNDSYHLTYIGLDTDAEIIEKLAEKDRYCASFERGSFILERSLWDRLGDLEGMLYMEPQTVNAFLYSDEDGMLDAAFELLAENLFTEEDGCLCNEDFPGLRIVIEGRARPGRDSGEAVRIILTGDTDPEETAERIDDSDNTYFVLRPAGRTEFRGLVNNCLLYDVDSDELSERILSIIADNGAAPALGIRWDLMKEQEYLLTEQERELLTGICAVRPMYRIAVPERLYLARTYTAAAEEIPAVTDSVFELKSSDTSVLKTEGMEIIPVGEGEAVLWLTPAHSSVKLAEKTVAVRNLKLIESIDVFPRTLSLAVNMAGSVEVTCQPSDAFNSDELQWRTEDESIAAVTPFGQITGIGCGTAVVTVFTPETETKLYVEVNPDIDDIELSHTYLEIKAGESAVWNYRVIPENCYQRDMVICRCSDESVASYRGGCIIGKSPGTASVSVCTPDNRIIKTCRVTVTKKKLFG